ncbi:unknown [Clostridium sp. CAG:81]|nr:unknown [Clostridium sp. CAG:81]
MRALVVTMGQNEAKRRIRAKKRQMIVRALVRYAVRLAILLFAWIGIFTLVVPYSTIGVAIVTAFLAMVPMMWGMEDME